MNHHVCNQVVHVLYDIIVPASKFIPFYNETFQLALDLVASQHRIDSYNRIESDHIYKNPKTNKIYIVRSIVDSCSFAKACMLQWRLNRTSINRHTTTTRQPPGGNKGRLHKTASVTRIFKIHNHIRRKPRAHVIYAHSFSPASLIRYVKEILSNLQLGGMFILDISFHDWSNLGKFIILANQMFNQLYYLHHMINNLAFPTRCLFICDNFLARSERVNPEDLLEISLDYTPISPELKDFLYLCRNMRLPQKEYKEKIKTELEKYTTVCLLSDNIKYTRLEVLTIGGGFGFCSRVHLNRNHPLV